MMKKKTTVGACILSTLLWAGAPSAALAQDGHEGHEHEQTPPAPDIQIEPDEGAQLFVDQRDHNFGRVLQGEVLEHTWSLANHGTRDLIITQAKPTCGCTVSNLMIEDGKGGFGEYRFGDPIPPKTKLQLTAKLNTKNKNSVASSKINVFSNDPRGLIQLGLQANVATYFNVVPNSVNLGDLSIGDAVDKTVEVTGQSDEPFKLQMPSMTFPGGMDVQLEAQEPDAEGRSKRWTVRVKFSAAREGRLGFPLQLQSDEVIKGVKEMVDGSLPTYATTVMISGNVKGLVTLSPSYLSFGLLRPGQVAARTVRVEVNDPNFELADPKVTLTGLRESEFAYAEYFTTTVRPVEGGKVIDVELTLTGFPQTMDGSFQGQLVIATGHPTSPEHKIAFSGVVRGGVKAEQQQQPPQEQKQEPK